MSTPETITSEIQKLEPSSIIELFELDATAIGGGINRFHAGTNGLNQNVTWQGEEYVRFPIQVSGFELSGTGSLPRPKVKVSNYLSSITTLLLAYNDLMGAKFTRRRTLQKYLDGINFPVQHISSSPHPTTGTIKLEWNGQQTSDLDFNAPGIDVENALNALTDIGTISCNGQLNLGGGVNISFLTYRGLAPLITVADNLTDGSFTIDYYNATADPDAAFPDDIFFVDRKSSENREGVEFELAASFDLQGVQLPRRQIVQNVCPWKYRGGECGYVGTNYFTTNNVATADSAQDVCGKRLSSCVLRFPNVSLPFGGFPAADLVK